MYALRVTRGRGPVGPDMSVRKMFQGQRLVSSVPSMGGMRAVRVNQLQYFESVARNLSFTKAADECHVAQPAISQQIHALEQELGFPLLVRSTKGVWLTEAGRVYYHEIAGVLGTLSRAARRARTIAEGKAGTLSVGITNSGQTAVLGVLKDFAAEYPAVLIELRRTHAADQYAQLVQGEFDVLVTATEYMSKRSDVRMVGCATAPLRIAMSKTHPLAGKKSLVVDDLRGYSLLLKTYPYLADDAQTPVVRVEDQGIGLATMLMGFGIEAVPEDVLPSMQDGYIVRDVEGYDAALEVGWAYLAENDNPALLPFIEFVKEHL